MSNKTFSGVNVRAVFILSVESNCEIALVLHCYSLCLAKKKFAPLYQPIRSTPNACNLFAWVYQRLASVTCFFLSSDWFIGLSASILIGQSNYFGFGLR